MELFKHFLENDDPTVIFKPDNLSNNHYILPDEALQGVADVLRSMQMQMKGSVAGSPAYIAPEQIGIKTDDPDDFGFLIWSLRGTDGANDAVEMAKSFRKLVREFDSFVKTYNSAGGNIRVRESVNRLDRYIASDLDRNNPDYKSQLERERWQNLSPEQRKGELAKKRQDYLNKQMQQFKLQRQRDIERGGTNPHAADKQTVFHLEDIEKKVSKLDRTIRDVQPPRNPKYDVAWIEVLKAYRAFRDTVTHNLPKIYKSLQIAAYQRMKGTT